MRRPALSTGERATGSSVLVFTKSFFGRRPALPTGERATGSSVLVSTKSCFVRRLALHLSIAAGPRGLRLRVSRCLVLHLAVTLEQIGLRLQVGQHPGLLLAKNKDPLGLRMQVGQQHGLLIAVALGQLGNRSLELPRMRLDSIGAGPGSRLKRLALLGADCDCLGPRCLGRASGLVSSVTCSIQRLGVWRLLRAAG
jgi:hypothetical protein